MNRPRRLILTGALLLLATAPLLAGAKRDRPPADIVRIHVLNVGQGDATIIEGPRDDSGDRKIMLVDTGESSMQGNEAKHVVEPYLREHTDDGKRARPVLDVDYMVLTHYHKDHMGSPKGKEPTGIFYLWEALNIRVGKILDTGLEYDAGGLGDTTYRQWVKDKSVDREKLAFDQLGPDRQIDMGEDLWIEVLSVAAEVEGRGRVVKDRWVNTTSQNDFSIQTVLHYKKFDFYIAGDLSGYLHESWGAWYHSIESAVSAHLRPVEVYRVNHHGSQWSSNYTFLQRLNPLVSVISSGKGHHHPNEYTVQRILGFEDYWTGRPAGSQIFQTKNDDGFVLDGPHPHTGKTQSVANGHIVIESDGVTGFTITLPGLEPYAFPLQDDPAFLDVPWSVKKAREGKPGDFERFYDADDVEDGRIAVPRGNDPDGGGD
jgi:beta-lactamase superfamily II metal-dependent hydrolase